MPNPRETAPKSSSRKAGKKHLRRNSEARSSAMSMKRKILDETPKSTISPPVSRAKTKNKD
jgi:hypothetical protein